ncbi:MAG: 2-oxo acid dehydrogenase subunit E2 [Chitinophagaceae bacterium]|nr:2-oxo acid dehydrogenase subunit E2 [Chitinophagaceae bacterium]
MAIVELVMPKMGESIMEATVLKWLKQPGDTVLMDEPVLEIATDKVDSEVPSTAAGVMEEVFFNVNDVVPVGTVIARIRTGAEEVKPAATPSPELPAGKSVSAPAVAPHIPEPVPAPVKQPEIVQELLQQNRPVQNTAGRFYSPLVLNIAASEGVGMQELETIPGTGNEGRVTKKDILQYVQDKKNGKTVSPTTQPAPAASAPAISSQSAVSTQPLTVSGNTEIIEMDRMRRLIADHMVRSKHTSPHVTSFTEADVTSLVQWREKVKKEFEKREGTKITFTPIFIEAIVKCIKKFPLINSSLDGDRIIVKKDINIGMATALPTGNLIVPVIKNADQLNLVGLSKQVNGLADAARNGKLKADDTQGGTFTMTNVGTFGSLMGTPIINQPQVAILAVGAIKKRPVVVETEAGDSIAIRHMMYLSMSYDHRIIDGSLGATFLTAVAKELENFNPEREV